MRPLLILDIDETLIHGREEPLERECEFRAGQFYIYLRPSVHDFLIAVSDFYDVAVWSSASIDYLEVIVGELSSSLPNGLLFVWDRSRCTRRFDFVNQDEYFVKDLKKVKSQGFDLKQVLILEDEPRKVQRNFGNAIYVKAFVGDLEDDELPKLANYLKSIHAFPNFRLVEKRNWRVSAEALDN